MKTCQWCGKITDDLKEYTDALDNTYQVCAECFQGTEDCICRKCGSTVDPSFMINGLCTNCIQADMKLKSKRQEEARMGIDTDLTNVLSSDLELTDKDYEKWMTMGKAFSPDNMKSVELRRLWIMVKLNATGIYDNEIISKNFTDIEVLLDRSFSKLVNNKCKILIGSTAETRKLVRESTVIDYEKEVYIIKA